jgi:hypothetical protein
MSNNNIVTSGGFDRTTDSIPQEYLRDPSFSPDCIGCDNLCYGGGCTKIRTRQTKKGQEQADFNEMPLPNRESRRIAKRAIEQGAELALKYPFSRKFWGMGDVIMVPYAGAFIGGSSVEIGVFARHVADSGAPIDGNALMTGILAAAAAGAIIFPAVGGGIIRGRTVLEGPKEEVVDVERALRTACGDRMRQKRDKKNDKAETVESPETES